MKSYTYRVIIEPDEKKTYHAYVPVLPGCHSWGKSILETKKNIKEAIALHLESLKTLKEKIPLEAEILESFETIILPNSKMYA